MNHQSKNSPARTTLTFFNKNGSRFYAFWFAWSLFFLFFATSLYAQVPVIPEFVEEELRQETPPDTILIEQVTTGKPEVNQRFVPDPSKSWRYSAIIPGWGQAYNRSYWKIPIIYAGLGAVVFVYGFNNNQFHKWRNAYIAKLDENIPDEFPNASAHAIRHLMDTYRRYREYTVLAGVAIYVFNILEAYVHAHLLNFDVGEDLSLRVEPNFLPVGSFGGYASNTFGLKLTLNF